MKEEHRNIQHGYTSVITLQEQKTENHVTTIELLKDLQTALSTKRKKQKRITVFPETKMNDVKLMNTSEKLLHDYRIALCDKGLCLARRQLRKKDFIDIRPLLNSLPKNIGHALPDSVMLSEDENIFAHQSGWYGLIPCFTEGVLQINSGRYIYWNIKDISYEKTMNVFLKDYIAFPEGWEGGVEGNTLFAFNNDTDEMLTTRSECLLHHDIYQLISTKEMGWDEEDAMVWNGLVVKNAKIKANVLKKQYHTDGFAELIRIFIILITKVNYQLYINKKAKTLRKESAKTKGKMSIEIIEQDAPKKLIRMIGCITITSEKPPRLPTEKTVTRYSVASWKCRGGLRHMQNGKIIPFKESVHHRQCMKSTIDVPQSIIKFKKEKNI